LGKDGKPIEPRVEIPDKDQAELYKEGEKHDRDHFQQVYLLKPLRNILSRHEQKMKKKPGTQDKFPMTTAWKKEMEAEKPMKIKDNENDRLESMQKRHVLMLVEILEKICGLETKICDVPTQGTDIVIKVRAPLSTLDYIAAKNKELMKLN